MAYPGAGSNFVDLTGDSDKEQGGLTGPARLTQLFKQSKAWTDSDDAEVPTRSQLTDTIHNLNGSERGGLGTTNGAAKGWTSDAPRKHAKTIGPPKDTASSTSTNGRGLFRVAGNGATDGHRQKRRKISSHTNAGLKLKNMNGGLTRHSLQAGLKSGGLAIKIPDDLLAAEPHSLFIPREPSSDRVESQRATTTSSLEETTPVTPPEPEPQASNFDISDEAMLGDDDVDRFFQNYRARPSESSRVGSENGLAQERVALQAPAYSNEEMVTPDSEVNESEFHPEMPDAPQASTPPGLEVEITNPGHQSRKDRRFREEDNDLLVYLKEVKGLGWAEIMREFPDRTKGVLNTHYCRQIRGMNWMESRSTLKLPPKYAAEAAVLWPQFRKERGLPLSGPVPLRTSHRERPINGMRALTLAQPARTEVSSSEPAPRQGPGRPKRNVASVNYTWPRRHRHRGVRAVEDEDEYGAPMDWEDSPSLEHLDSASVRPDVVALPVQEPMDMAFDSEDARFVTSHDANPPYLSSSERKLIQERSLEGEWDQLSSRKWQGTVVHVDFGQEEMETVEIALRRMGGGIYSTSTSGDIRKRLRRAVNNLSEPKLLQLSHSLRRKLKRDQASVDGFLQDAAVGQLSASPTIQRIGAARVIRTFSSSARTSTSSLLRQRETGLQVRRGWKSASRPLNYQFKNNVYDTLGPTLSYTGASSDVNTVAWSPDGLYFAAGAVCVTDPESMLYNRPNNLLYGDVAKKSIHELPEHCEERKKPESGPNSTHEMHVTQDPSLYYTVSSVAFSADGNWMFSASYDRTVMAWHTHDQDTGERCQPKLFKALEHKAEVDIIAVNQHNNLATASKRWRNAIKVCTIEGDKIVPTTFSSKKATDREDLKILPTALRFEPSYGRMLLAGFGANKCEDRLDTSGDICLWDVETQQEIMVYGSTANVFDVAWAPKHASVFAASCVAGGSVNRGTRSVVRLYDGRGHEKRSKFMETECPALDMNDVVFCPYDDYLIAAGCTSGSTYVWDLRRPDQHLYQLDHGKSLMPLPDDVPREVSDTGVRFLSWGDNATRLYTGSSDGVVKVWDVARSHQDVFIKDLVTFDTGIMCGMFSPDKSRLVLGEVNGSINVLEVGNEDRSVKEMEKMAYVPYGDHNEESMADLDLAESGRKTAAELVSRGEIVNVAFGGFPFRQAVQGPNYKGPFDGGVDAPYLREQALEFQNSLAGQTSQSCNIASCRDGLQKITAEEGGDSGRSADRIPDELRKTWSAVGSVGSEQAVVPGKSRCQNPTCGGVARSGNVEGEKRLCERCHFTCFRCSGVCKILHPGIDDKVVCQSCLKVWEIGALGYEPIDDGVMAATMSDYPVPSLPRWERALKGEKERDERKGASWGDELNALGDHYFGLTLRNVQS